MRKKSLFLLFFCSAVLSATGIQLICNTKNESCHIKSAIYDFEEEPQVNFTFIMKGSDKVTQIRFENSEIGELPKVIFERFKNLQVLDLKFCAVKRFRKSSLENAHNLTEIDLSYNKLKRLEENLFAVCTKLVTLNLFRNTIVEVNEKAFAGLSNLERLVLSSNEIRRLRQNVFQDLTSLTELDLKKNRIEDIGTALQTLKQLEILDLSFNKIKNVSKSSFSGLKSLEILDLSNNRIEFVDFDVFQANPVLEAVNFANNKLKELTLKVFSASFRILDISQNALTHVNVTSGVVSVPHRTKTSINVDDNWLEMISVDDDLPLRKLSMARNNVSSLEFLGNCCANLTSIDISHNPLESRAKNDKKLRSKGVLTLVARNISAHDATAVDVIFDLLEETPLLQSLDVSQNNLAAVDWTLLPKLNDLTTLKVENCSIAHSDDLISTFPNLTMLHFGGNLINCDHLSSNGKVECHN
ncbi:toll-like receptor 3 [Culicoides brevitarsis]|uniref:toll-like receptor 3 n=1 Tax=Culicoides brevitarsis TaxID=469753 RepID=UPI00307BAF27